MNTFKSSIMFKFKLLPLDAILMIVMFILAIVCAVKEGSIKEPPNLEWLDKGLINVGAFGSASVRL